MPTIITIKGIEESIFNLQYRNKSALKYQLVHAIREFYQDKKSTETLQIIDGDELINRLWQIGDDPIAIKNKRKNLNSIKSTVNTDLRKLYQEGLNPEGIIIGPDNVFIMSEEAKEAVFENFRSTMGKTGLVDLGKMLEVLNIINESLFDVEGIIEKEGTNAAEKMNKLKSLIQGLAGKVNLERSFLERSPEKLQIPTDQEERMRSKEPQSESAAPEPWTPAEGKAPLQELSDYPEHEEPETAGEVFEEALDQDEMAQLRLDAELETAELSGDELDRLDEMALEDQSIDSQAFIEQEIVEEGPELSAEPADPEEPFFKDDDEIEIPSEQAPVEDQEIETNEFVIDAESAMEELRAVDAEIADDIGFIAEEELIENAEIFEKLSTETQEALTEEQAFEIDADVETDDSIIEDEVEAAESDVVVADIESLEPFEEESKETIDGIDGEVPEVEIEDLKNPKTAESQELPEELLETEETDAISLPEDEELAEDLEPEEDKIDEEDRVDLKGLEAIEALSEPEEILEEASEGIEELDLEEPEEEPAISILSEADQKEEVPGLETELSSFGEDIGLADDIPEMSEEQIPALGEEEFSEALIEEEEIIIGEEPEADMEPETDFLAEPLEDQGLIDEGEIDAEPEETTEEELEEVEGLDVETVSAELSADEILEEVEDEPLTEAMIETEEDGFIERESTADDLYASAGESEAAPPILPEGLFGFAEADIKVNTERARYLAEGFNDSLAAMDKFHNQYILIPQGRYVIGSRQAQSGTQAERVKELPAFYMGKFPVINALFEIFIEKTGYKTTAEKKGFGLVYYPRCRQTKNERSGLNMYTYRSALVSEVVKGACWYQPSGPGSTLHNKRNHPVVQVGLEDALAFAAWTGKRLPREEEWEAAARGVKGLIYPWGVRWKKGACNVEESDLGDTAPVEFYAEFGSEFGLADMLGNVSEWTLDPVEENGRRHYVVKGGSWISKPGVRLTECLKLEKEICSNILGFRCVAY